MNTEYGTSKTKILIRLFTSTAAILRLEKIWKSREIELNIKYKLYTSLLLSILLYGCETWNLLIEYKKKSRVFEYKAYRRLLNIIYK